MRPRKYLEVGAIAKDGSGAPIKWNGERFEGVDKDICNLKFEEREIYYAWDVPEGSQNRGKPYIELPSEEN